MADKTDKNKWIDDIDTTRAFSPVSASDNSDQGETRKFSLDGGPEEPRERCEERGSLKELPTGALIWRIGRPLLILLISLAIILFLGITAFHFIQDSYISPVAADTSQLVHVEIKSGSSLSTIASELYDNGIIRNKFAFQLYVDLNDMGGSLQAGKYDLSPGMTLEQIADKLAEGDGGRKTFKITFTEGSTVTNMADKLVEKGIFDRKKRNEFLKLCNDAKAFADYDFIAALQSTAKLEGRRYLLEGYLFPDTYEFYVDVEPIDVIKKLLGRFDEIFIAEYEERAEEIGMTIDQVVTLASIIEWEAQPGDFKKVSAVFYNRIDDEEILGSCATMGYVTGVKKLTYTEDERAIDSPYNTYKYAGLPIGPIASPGEKAIAAALFPDEEFRSEGYFYFCSKDPKTGELAFAKTMAEHDENVALYKDLWDVQ